METQNSRPAQKITKIPEGSSLWISVAAAAEGRGEREEEEEDEGKQEKKRP